jgi:hypothetical protein
MNKKGYGFSKYDNEGRVIYSESKGVYGELVKHHYKYDTLGRRIYYAEYNNDELILEEWYTYIDNLIYETIIWYREEVFIQKTINSMGREIYIKTIILKDNQNTSTIKTYNSANGTYDIKQSAELFVPVIKK